VQMVATKPKPVVMVVLAGGAQTRLTPKYRPGPRTFAALGLVAFLGAFGWHALWAIPVVRDSIMGQLGDYDTYPHRYLNNALVESTFNGRLSRYTTYTGRIDDESRLDYGMSYTTASSISRRDRFYGPTTLDYQTFAIEFELQARAAHSPVTVDAIRVIVDAYERLPSYETPVGGRLGTSVAPFHLYHAVLGRPSDGRNRKVLAQLVATEDATSGEACEQLCLSQEGGGGVQVTAARPTSFLVKIESADPGFYGFDVEVMLSSGAEVQRFRVATFTHVLFY